MHYNREKIMNDSKCVLTIILDILSFSADVQCFPVFLCVSTTKSRTQASIIILKIHKGSSFSLYDRRSPSSTVEYV